MPLKILYHPNPILRRKSVEISEITDEIRNLAAEMAESMYNAEGIGLAAPQIGQSLRLITIDISGPHKREDLLTLINPVLTPFPEEGYLESEEGCLSVEDYKAKVRRFAKVHLDALDLQGKPIHRDAEELLSVCLQHEVDHLDGKLFIDHLSFLKRSMYEAKLHKQIKNREKNSRL